MLNKFTQEKQEKKYYSAIAITVLFQWQKLDIYHIIDNIQQFNFIITLAKLFYLKQTANTQNLNLGIQRMKNFDTNANELIAHTHSLLSKKKVKIQDLIQVLEAERLLEDHSDKGLFILLVSEIFQKVFVGFNTRLLSFKQGIFKGEVEKEKKVRYGGKSKGGKGTRKRRVLKQNKDKTLQDMAWEALSDPSNVQSKSSRGAAQEKRQNKNEVSENSQNTQSQNNKKINQAEFADLALPVQDPFQSIPVADGFEQNLGESSNTTTSYSDNFTELSKKRTQFYGASIDITAPRRRKMSSRGQSRIITKKKKIANRLDISIFLDTNEFTKLDASLNESKLSAFKSSDSTVIRLHRLKESLLNQKQIRVQQFKDKLQSVKRFDKIFLQDQKRKKQEEGENYFTQLSQNEGDYELEYSQPSIQYKELKTSYEEIEIGKPMKFSYFHQQPKKTQALIFREMLFKRKTGQLQMQQQNPQKFGDIEFVKKRAL